MGSKNDKGEKRNKSRVEPKIDIITRPKPDEREIRHYVIKTTVVTILGVFVATGVFLSFIDLFLKAK